MMVIKRFLFFLITCKVVKGLVHSSYVGCFEDSIENRRLKGYNISLSNMTSHTCNFICFHKGFIYAGTQNKDECYCGDHDDRPDPSPIDDSYCDHQDLVGDIRHGGEKLTLTVYKTGIEDMKFVDWKLIGCINDDENDFLIPQTKLEFVKTNSPGRCVSACTSMGFKHAGLSQSKLCFCGAAKKIEKVTGCDLPCPKRSNKPCGGFMKINLYQASDDPGFTPPEVKDLGCFKNRPDGLLRDYSESSPDMTRFKCISICLEKGFPYSGVYNGRGCQCSLQEPFPSPDFALEEQCSQKCAGNSKETCGAANYLKGFATSVVGRHPLYGKWLGCFRDNDNFVKEKIIMINDNNPIICVSECLKIGFAIAAVTKSICICSNVMVTKKQGMLEDSFCESPCYDGSLTCGGDTALSVYRTGINTFQKGCVKSITEIKDIQVCRGKEIFRDDFDSLDLNKWQRTVKISGEDYEFVTYTYEKKNSYVKDGKLHLKPLVHSDDFVINGNISLDGCTGVGDECHSKAVSFRILPPITTAQFTTKNTFSFKYGVITIRAKLPRGDWIYPELWLKPTVNVYGPSYWSGKMVLASASGNRNLRTNSGEDISVSTLEGGIIMGHPPDNFRSKKVYFRDGKWDQEFHNYTIKWTPESISMHVDDKLIEKKVIVEMNDRKRLSNEVGFSKKDSHVWNDGSSAAPFDQMFFLTIGVGVGGNTFFPDSSTSIEVEKPWKNYQVKAMLNFWHAKNLWNPTWSEHSTLIIDSISVKAL